MTQKDKKLLLKDLCARLPYGLKVKIKHYDDAWELLAIYINGTTYATRDVGYPIETYFEDCKPYLFPLSSMSDELWDKEFRGCGITEFTRDSFKYGCETLVFNNCNPKLSSTVKFINQLIKNHFDIYGLIPKGLALDATGLNIY